MRVIVLLFIGFCCVGAKVWIENEDRNLSFEDYRTTETSHESYKPNAYEFEDQVETLTGQEESFSEVFQSTEQSDHEFSQEVEFPSIGTITEPEKDSFTNLNLFAREASKSSKLQNYEKRVISNENDNKCGKNKINSQISQYLKQANEVVEVNSGDLSSGGTSPLEFSIEHDLFEVNPNNGGILKDVSYKVEVQSSPTNSIIDFILESIGNNDEDIGEFLAPPQAKQNKVLEKPKSKTLDSESDKNESVQKDLKINHRGSEVFHKFEKGTKNGTKQKVVWDWIGRSNQVEHCLKNKNSEQRVNFRLFFRVENRREIFFTKISLNVLKECSLTIDKFQGRLDSFTLPNSYDRCEVRFSQLLDKQYGDNHQPGLLIKIMKLNVPCENGGFLKLGQINSNDPTILCGKLEEISEPRRTLYLPSFSKTVISAYKNPKFEITFKMVDYCYDVTFLESESSFSIATTDLIHSCNFKIHMPYGNRIRLNLFLRNAFNNIFDNAFEQSNLTNIKIVENSEYDKIDNPDILDSEFNSTLGNSKEEKCNSGIFIEVSNYGNGKWSQCISSSQPVKRAEYSLMSDQNFVRVRITKKSSETSNQQYYSASDAAIILNYSAVPYESIVSRCGFGWVTYEESCFSVFHQLMTWQKAEDFCINNASGHLVSVRNDYQQQIIDKMLLKSPHYNERNSYWIGASDKSLEGDFKWNDGSTFSFSKWFPGWEENNNYNRQPNDDGLSDQDCVEIRRFFILPVLSSLNPNKTLSESFMWNDRDCNALNYFICERPLNHESLNRPDVDDCNKTIHLTKENKKSTITTPGFPSFYSGNRDCFTTIIAPQGYRVLLEFEEFVLENEPQCQYDFLKISEEDGQENSSGPEIISNNLPENMKNRESSAELLFEPSNIIPKFQRSLKNDFTPRRICGDWSSKLKLLRYRSQGGQLNLHFHSDYSHHFSGFRAKTSLEKDETDECSDDRLKYFNGSCYLVVNFPEVEWVVAQKICNSMGAQLSSVANSEENRFIISIVKNHGDYSPRSFYWLGARYSENNDLRWSDGIQTNFEGWFSSADKIAKTKADQNCLGFQWHVSHNPSIHSDLYWTMQKCSSLGGYVCKKVHGNVDLKQNQTITGIEGRLTSPDYPNKYSPNIDFSCQIIAPEKSRIIIQFQKIDIEAQEDCLYDYISMYDSSYNHAAMLISREDPTPNDFDIDASNQEKPDRKQSEVLKNGVENGLAVSAATTFKPYARYCGQREGDMSSFDFVSRTNEIVFNFVTDFSLSGEGFSATWHSIDLSACGQAVTSREGTIESPNFPNFLLHELNCSYTILAPQGRRVMVNFSRFDIKSDAIVYVDLGDGPFKYKQTHIGDGVFLSYTEKLRITLMTGAQPVGRGFQLTYKAVMNADEETIVNLSDATNGHLYYINYPHPMPAKVKFLQHLIAPTGHVISIQLNDVQITSTENCENGNTLEVIDNYAEKNGTKWVLCKSDSQNSTQTEEAVFITSYLNTLHVRQHSASTSQKVLNATVRTFPDTNHKIKLISTLDDWVESCNPNPCQFGGKCVSFGKKQVCQCKSHYTGRFCSLTMCEVQPCVFGQCELTTGGFKCRCQKGYTGTICEKRQKPCNDNPCEGRGECIEKNGSFSCRCFAWYEGTKCEKRMKIPYRPLSERMLQEPFWLGLITVFIVLSIIGLVWCAKRHFPEKIEKLLAEEANRNRPAHLRQSHLVSLREQLQVAGGSAHSNGHQQVTSAPTGQKSIFGRLGIRKPSLLSLSSPQLRENNSAARTFSLDDLLSPIPRRSPSPRKKRNNSTPSRQYAAENKQTLQKLISSNTTKVTLGDLIHLSDTDDFSNRHLKSPDCRETAFIDKYSSESSKNLPKQVFSDPKLEKKVTFARLLNKVSAEINSAPSFDDNNHSSALSLPAEMHHRTNSVPQLPPTKEDHRSSLTISSTKKNSFSSSELALHNQSFSSESRSERPKVSSADSILTMFKNLKSSNMPSSFIVSTSSTPLAMSPMDDDLDDEDSFSSGLNLASFSSNAPDSPVFFNQKAIETPTYEQSHKSNPTQNPHLILLEIPGTSNKCLSPIREMPTPIPSPALTPVMLRRQHMVKAQAEETLSVTFSDDDLDLDSSVQAACHRNQNLICDESNASSSSFDFKPRRIVPSSLNLSRAPTIIPELVIEIPSPTEDRSPVNYGSPPPHKSRNSEDISQAEGDREKVSMANTKQRSLDLPCIPPRITITMSACEFESDVELTSEALSSQKFSLSKAADKSRMMTYLSPFVNYNKDRAPSEGNLSSSGYDSMASPSLSRSGSHTKILRDVDEDCETITIDVPQCFHPLNQKNSEFEFKISSPPDDFNFPKSGNSKSDSIALEICIESNDEGIETDQVEEGDLKKLGKKTVSDSTFLEDVTNKLQLPSITVSNAEGGCDKISPLSSRSESPLSDRNITNTVSQISTLFYGKKNQLLPFTDSDGVYDFPSSSEVSGKVSHKKNVSKRRERRSSKHAVIPGLPSVEVPAKPQPSTKHYQNIGAFNRKSPKRRPLQRYTPSSSSSDESLATEQSNASKLNKDSRR